MPFTLDRDLVTNVYAQASGFRFIQTPANPAAGAKLTVTVPGGQIRRLLAGTLLLTTSAAVANRVPFVEVLNADGLIEYHAPQGGAITAGLAATVAISPQFTIQTALVNAAALLLVPDYYLLPGEQLVVDVSNIQAADQISKVVLVWDVIPIGQGGVDQSST